MRFKWILVFFIAIAFVSINVGASDRGSERPSREAQRSEESGMSRRGFLRGLFAGAAVVAVNPVSAITASMEGLKAGLPEALKRKLVQLRLKTIYTVGSEASATPDPFFGLKNYIKILEDLVQQTPSLEHKAILMKKVSAAQEALVAYQEVFVRGLASQTSADLNTESSQESWQKDLQQIQDQADQEHDLNSSMIEDFNQLSLDVRVVAIRGLLGPDLLRKMAWQVHFVNLEAEEYSVILNRSEVSLIMQYYAFLHQAMTELEKEKLILASKGMDDLSASPTVTEFLLTQFMDEAREVILAYHKATKPQRLGASSANSCLNYLQ